MRGATLAQRLAEPVAPGSLAFARIAFGTLLLVEVVRYFAAGWIHEYYVAPAFHFRYHGFEFVRPLPEPWLELLFGALGLLAAGIALGWRTRLCALLFFIGFGYVFLLEQARYLNHFYLVLLLAVLFAWAPTDGARPLPAWALLLFRMQIAIVYVYAGIAKLNGDWLRGEPLRMWLRSRDDGSWLGTLLGQAWMPWILSYGGLAFDLLVVPLLLWRRTRAGAFVIALLFHGGNALLFDIGIFPWLALATTTLFFAPDWPSRLLARVRGRRSEVAVPASAGAWTPPRPRPLLLLSWLAFQLAFPLRHLLYPGEVSWTEEGHKFSWHMKLRSKSAEATFIVTDPATARPRYVDPRVELTDWQYRKMADRPEMILQYAHHLAAKFGREGPVEVRAVVDCSLNGRALQPLIDPAVDLARVEPSLWPAPWIVPLREPLPPPGQARQPVFDE